MVNDFFIDGGMDVRKAGLSGLRAGCAGARVHILGL